MEGIVIGTINNFGYIGIILLIAIENIFPPIPSEVILTFGGFATTISHITVIGTIIAATIGSVIGAIILYYIGRILNKQRIDKFTKSKIGKLLRLKKADINKAFYWFENKGKSAVFLGRFIPIVRSLISIPAGMAKMKMAPFFILTTIGSLIWNTVLISLGRLAGESWGQIAGYIGEYSDIVLYGVIFLSVVGILISYLRKSKKITIIRIRKNR